MDLFDNPRLCDKDIHSLTNPLDHVPRTEIQGFVLRPWHLAFDEHAKSGRQPGQIQYNFVEACIRRLNAA